jgi:hypothetical protein
MLRLSFNHRPEFSVVNNQVLPLASRDLQPLNSDRSFVMLSIEKLEKKDETHTVGNCYQCDYPF